MTADVEVFLDLRGWRHGVREPDQFIDLWTRVERALAKRTLDPARVHRVTLGDGEVRFTIAGLRSRHHPQVLPGTRFRVVNVLEPPAPQRPCAPCVRAGTATPGVFRCPDCPDDAGSWRCADHVNFLDGALIATCDRHRPRCVECGQEATFRCPGDRCRGRTAHCARHRTAHPQDPDLAYCPTCFTDGFPTCTVDGCRNIGAVPCELPDNKLRRCGVRRCALHLARWQVFGPERLGLALCDRHQQSLRGTQPADLIRWIVIGTFLRATERRDAEPLPSLRAFAHTLRNQGHHERALEYEWIHATLLSMAAGAGRRPGAEGLDVMLRERDGDGPAAAGERDRRVGRARTHRGWRDEMTALRRAAKTGGDYVDRLRRVIRERFGRDGERLAKAISLAEYKEPTVVRGEERRGLLFVRVPRDQQQLFERGKAYFGRHLSSVERKGVQVEIEGGDRHDHAQRGDRGQRTQHDGRARRDGRPGPGTRDAQNKRR